MSGHVERPVESASPLSTVLQTRSRAALSGACSAVRASRSSAAGDQHAGAQHDRELSEDGGKNGATLCQRNTREALVAWSRCLDAGVAGGTTSGDGGGAPANCCTTSGLPCHWWPAGAAGGGGEGPIQVAREAAQAGRRLGGGRAGHGMEIEQLQQGAAPGAGYFRAGCEKRCATRWESARDATCGGSPVISQ